MPKPRSQLVDLDATSYYHCISRCVRRAFLCGHDRLSGNSFDHRKSWIADRIKELVRIFAIEVCSYGLMSNHFHLVLHVDAERAQTWTDEEVFERYEQLFPNTVRLARLMAPGARKRKAQLWRARLFDLSWFMRCLNESIARRANREDNCSGRFWEGRFRSQALLDTGALLTCMTYVDLNPIRAGLVEVLEDSEFTSIRERLLAAARRVEGLVPFADQVRPDEGDRMIPMTFPDYVELLRWTVAALRTKRSDSARAPKLIDRLGLEPDGFVHTVENFSRTFFTMVGHSHHIAIQAERRGYRRSPDMRAALRLYSAQLS